jgi:hypothetical protein
MQFSSVLLLLPALWLSFFSCNQGNVELDNAGDKPLTVRVDELTYRLGAGEYKLIQLDKGRHIITVTDEAGEKLNEGTFSVDKGGLLNVAAASYYIWTDLYGNTANKEKHLNEAWLKIGKDEIYGEFTQLSKDQLYTEKAWDFGLAENFPEYRFGMELTDDKYVLESKLYRESQLVDAYYQATEEPQ